MAAGDAYDNAMFGMADPNVSATSGGKIQKSITDMDAGLNKLLGTLGKIERKLGNIEKKAQSLGSALGGGGGTVAGGGSNKNGRQSPSFPNTSSVGAGADAIPGLHGLPANPGTSGTPQPGRLTPIRASFGGVGTALAEAGVAAALQSTGGLYDQDRLYTSMRLSGMVGSRSAQSGLARGFASSFTGSYTSQDDLQQAQYALRGIGFANRNYTPQFAAGMTNYARMSNSASLSDAMGQYASLNAAPTQNMLRAYGIKVRGNDMTSVMDALFKQTFARAGGKPSTDQLETSFQVGGNAYQTAVNMGLDPAAFKDYAMSKVNPDAAKAIKQSVPGTSKDRAGKSNTFMQDGYGSRVGVTNSTNRLLGHVSGMLDDYLPFLANLKAMGDGLNTLGGNPAGGRNVLGSALHSLIEGMILKSLLKGGGGAAGSAAGGGALRGLLPVGAGLGAGLVGMSALATSGIGANVGEKVGRGVGHKSTGGVIGSVGAGAATGAGLGLLGGPFAEISVPVGAAIGGGVGLVGGLLKEMGGPDSKKAGTDGGGGQTYQTLEDLAKGLGNGYAITSTTSGKHAGGSMHYAGDAIDIGSRPTAGDPKSLLRINQYFASKYGSHLSELIYGGPGGISIKNGKVVDGYKVYGAATMAEHRDHVHVGATPAMLGDASGGGASSASDSSTTGSGAVGPGGIGSAVNAMAAAARSAYVIAPEASVGAGGAAGTSTSAASGGSTGATSAAASAPTDTKGSVALGKKMAAARGWSGAEWDALYALWNKESSWNPNAVNGKSSARGIPQAMMSAHFGKNWQDPSNVGAHKFLTDPATQIQWGLDYISQRYGDPAKAWAHSQQNNWYSKGAWRIANDKKANLHEGEMVLPARIAEAVRGEMGRGMSTQSVGGGGNKVEINLTVARATDAEAQRFAMKVKRMLQDDEYMNKIAAGAV